MNKTKILYIYTLVFLFVICNKVLLMVFIIIIHIQFSIYISAYRLFSMHVLPSISVEGEVILLNQPPI